MQSEISTAGAAQDRGRTVEELERELSEAHRREAATAEVLKVIRSSPTDVQAVFDTIVRSAVLLCDAVYGSAVRFDGKLMHLVAKYNYTPEVDRALREAFPMRPSLRMMSGRAILTRDVVQVEDALEDPDYPKDVVQAGGFRSMLAAPMLRDGRPIGAIVVNRGQPGPFSPTQIQLLRTFADQAVIAIENTRLFEAEQASKRELQESLEYQTAIGEVLGVISRSPSELQPALDAIASIASRLCAADDTSIRLKEGGDLRNAAHHGTIPIKLNLKRPIGRDFVAGRTVVDREPVHVHDLTAAGDEFPLGRDIALEEGHRTTLGIPLLRGDQAVGSIVLRRTEVRPFSDKHIAVLKTFADQAVIAIENTRLFEEVQARTRELQESLEYQTATSDVLQVISSSLGQMQPVYETMLANALRHCDAKFGGLFRYENGAFRGVAGIGVPEGLLVSASAGSHRAANTDLEELVASRQPIHSPDLRQNASYLAGDPFIVGAVERGGARAALLVPLVKEHNLIGALAIYRQEVRPFTDKQIQLVQTFADQAVIAIENTRLFEAEQARTKELQARSAELAQSLEYQTATSEVLGVISRSTFDLKPVLEAVVESATRLCGATRGHIFRFDGQYLRFAAAYGAWPEFMTYLETHQFSPGRGSVSTRAALERRTIHVPDVLLEPGYELGDLVKTQGYRTVLAVPMLREGALLGVIAILKTNVELFTEKQVALVETFADQAVIAIENARLFEEVAGAHEGAERVAGAADGHVGNPASHQQFAQRHAAGIRRHRAERVEALSGRPRQRRAQVWGRDQRRGRRRAGSGSRRSLATHNFPYPSGAELHARRSLA